MNQGEIEQETAGLEAGKRIEEAAPTRQQTIFKGLFFVIYLTLVIITIAFFFQTRAWALRELQAGSDSAWSQWKQAAESQAAGDGPVQRRPIETSKPPLLLLMRDHFWTCLLSTLFVGTAIYTVIAWMILGAIRPSTNQV